MLVTTIGIISIVAGFICVLSAYYFFQRAGEEGSKRPSIILGLLSVLFLTIIPVFCAIFFAATENH